MAYREYIGSRYVPIFGRKGETTIEWDNLAPYEPLTVVTHAGTSYVSRQYVPKGIDILNENYWIHWSDFNAQIEQYRQEVLGFDGRIRETENDITGLANNVDELENTVTNELNTIKSDSWVTANRIANNAVTNDKINNGAVTNDKIANGTIEAEKIADNTIGGSKIKDNSIGYSDLNSALQARIGSNSLESKNVICIGDSYGRGVGGSDDHGWPYYLNNFCKFNNFLNVSNSGAGFIATGHSSPYGSITFNGQINWAYDNLPSSMAANEVNIIIIAGGYNDHAQEGPAIRSAVREAIRNAQTKFPNAQVYFFPLCVGDRDLDNSYTRSYEYMVYAAATAGAQTTDTSMYWLYPYTNSTSYGDQIHPNDSGYQTIGAFLGASLISGNVSAHTEVLAASGEGFSFAEDATNVNFRAGVQNGMAFYGGHLKRKGWGDLLTLPSYCRPRETEYFPAFVYADSTHHGIARIRVLTNGRITFFTMETGTYDESLTYDVYIPRTVLPLGKII